MISPGDDEILIRCNQSRQTGWARLLSQFVAGSILECIPFTCTFIVGISIHLIFHLVDFRMEVEVGEIRSR